MANKCCQLANNGNLAQKVSIAAALMTAAKAGGIESAFAARGSEAEGASRKPPHCCVIGGRRGRRPGALLCRGRPMTAENRMPRTLLPTLCGLFWERSLCLTSSDTAHPIRQSCKILKSMSSDVALAQPEKRRRLDRVIAACDLCKRRKVKCDGVCEASLCRSRCAIVLHPTASLINVDSD